MGNAGCIGKHAGLDSLCAGRGFPEFIAPNTEHVTYCFNYAMEGEMKFLNGVTGLVSPQGFTLEPQVSERRAPKWYIVKDYTPNAAQLRLHVSGRTFMECLDKALPCTTTASVCAFKICTRGIPIYESIRTDNFTHTAHVVTSGIFFALNVACSSQGLILCPRLLLVLESGDEVMLVDDRLGPLQPQSYYIDFALLDDGGRNVQVDLIFRALPGEGSSEESMRTLRTCLQDYVAFNNQVFPASISFSSSDLASLLPASSVHLQNLVISEEKFEEQVPEPQPYDVWKEGDHRVDRDGYGKVLYEGEDARTSSLAMDTPEGSIAHPQLQTSRCPAAGHDKITKVTRSGLQNEATSEVCTDDFWHHVRYDDECGGSRAPNTNSPEDMTRLKGEFWLSKQAVDKKNVYFYCSSTLAQAVTMCIAFRFSCPLDYLQLIERAGGEGSGRREAVSTLRDGHIPANGVVLGIEHDPRHRSLVRMFIEHRNDIKDDMVVCECRLDDLSRSVVHQEVYDGGGVILYRLTLLHSNGARQSAVLQMSTEEFEDANLDSARGSQYRLVEEPSPRFPISPCQVSQSLSPANRVFLYTTTAAADPRAAPHHTVCAVAGGPQSSEEAGTTDAASEGAGGRTPPAGTEDWQSVGGGYSDCEVESAPPGAEPLRSGPIASSGWPPGMSVEWRRPLIESAVLLSRVEEAPFKCFPSSLS
mmetsp:Transcript_76422/g.211100  ORF Transcript_76422/g.211100 Transcript_76422/m.211100 type:complete len:700 (-) Transcript_76422:94-2193(-)